MTEPRRTVEGAGPGDRDDWNEDPEPAAPREPTNDDLWATVAASMEAAERHKLAIYRGEGVAPPDALAGIEAHIAAGLAAKVLYHRALAATGDSEGPEERCYCAAHPHNGHPVDKDTDR